MIAGDRKRPEFPVQRVVRVLNRIVAYRWHPLKMQMDAGPELVSLA